MSVEQHVFRREKPDGTVLRAWLEEDGAGYVMRVQWVKSNGKPYHQPLEVGLSSAEGTFTQLAGFASEMRARADS